MMLIDRKKVGERIRQAMLQAGYKKNVRLANVLEKLNMKGGDPGGVSVGRWIKGDGIRLENLNKLSLVLHKPALWFLEGTESDEDDVLGEIE